MIGYPTLRLRGDYLAIMTLGFGETIRTTSINWTSFTHGTNGIPGIPQPGLPGFEINTVVRFFYVAGVLALVAVVLIRRLLRSHIGRAWISIREDEDVAESIGIPTSRYKLYAYTSGAICAGCMGVFFAHFQQYISPDSFSLLENVIILLLVVIGGLGSLMGPILGSAIWFIGVDGLANITLVQQHPELRQMILAALLVLIMIFRPRGILGEAKTLTSSRGLIVRTKAVGG